MDHKYGSQANSENNVADLAVGVRVVTCAIGGVLVCVEWLAQMVVHFAYGDRRRLGQEY